MAKIARDAVLIKQNHAGCPPFEEEREDLVWLCGFVCFADATWHDPYAGAAERDACARGMK